MVGATHGRGILVLGTGSSRLLVTASANLLSEELSSGNLLNSLHPLGFRGLGFSCLGFGV